MFNIKTFYDRGASYSSESPKTPEMERVFIRDMFLVNLILQHLQRGNTAISLLFF